MKDKISLYDILNKFFIGSVFTILFYFITYDKAPFADVYKNISDLLANLGIIVSAVLFILVYEIGFILNRSSSVIIEPILKKTKLWPKDKYSIDISEIKKCNETFNSMITELVLTRTHILVYLLLVIFSLIYNKWFLSGLFILIIILLVISGRKHNNRINTVRKDYSKRKKYEFKLNQETKNFNSFDGSPQLEETSNIKK